MKKVTTPKMAMACLITLVAIAIASSLQFVALSPVLVIPVAVGLAYVMFATYKTQKIAKEQAERKIPILRMRNRKVAEQAHDFIISRVVELRRPLQGLVGIQELFSADNTAESAKDFFEIAEFCSRYLIRQLERVQFFSELENQALRFEKTDFSLRKMVSDAIKMSSEQANSKEVTIVEDWSADLPETINAQEKAIRQVLIELLDNSIRFAGGRKVHIKISADPDDNKSVFIHVSDAGPGLSEAQIENLKSPITTAERMIPWSEIKKGLGHVIIKKLNDKIGGRLFVDSRRGVGTSVSMSFRCEPALAHSTPSAQPARRVHRAPLRILVVDDELVTRQVVCALLKSLGFSPETAINGHDAVLRAQRDQYDLIFMDVEMPVLDGMQASQIILNELHLTQKPHIAMLTSHCTQEDRDKIAKIGVTQFLAKPSGRAEIELAVERAYENIDENEKLEKEAEEYLKLDDRAEARAKEPGYLIDFNKLYSSFGENISACRQVLYNASDAIAADLANLTEVFGQRNTKNALSILHKLRGEVGAIMCTRAVESIDRMTENLKASDFSAAQKEFEVLVDVIETVQSEIEGLNQQNLQVA